MDYYLPFILWRFCIGILRAYCDIDRYVKLDSCVCSGSVEFWSFTDSFPIDIWLPMLSHTEFKASKMCFNRLTSTGEESHDGIYNGLSEFGRLLLTSYYFVSTACKICGSLSSVGCSLLNSACNLWHHRCWRVYMMNFRCRTGSGTWIEECIPTWVQERWSKCLKLEGAHAAHYHTTPSSYRSPNASTYSDIAKSVARRDDYRCFESPVKKIKGLPRKMTEIFYNRKGPPCTSILEALLARKSAIAQGGMQRLLLSRKAP